jgi:hypothetical protein
MGWGGWRFPLPFGCFPPSMPLDWAWGCDKDVCLVVGFSSKGFEDTSLALLTTIKEDLHQVVKGTRPKTRG